MARPPIARNVDSRTRLLNSLGLFQPHQQRNSVPTLDSRDSSPSTDTASDGEGKKKIRQIRHIRSLSDIPSRSALHNTVAFETRLNDESISRGSKENRNTKPRRSSFSDKEKDNSSGSVRFNTVVSGIKIPSRNQYSRRIKQTLWRDRYELSEMVERNTTEFHAENYDWNQVVLDDEMYVDASSGEKVHPCHVEGSYFDESKENDDSEYDDSSGCLGFAPLSRSDSMVGDNSSL